MQKKIIFILLVISTYLLTAQESSNQEIVNQNGLSFQVFPGSDLNYAVLIGRERFNTNTDIIIPDTVTDDFGVEYVVTDISASAFENNELTSVVIPNGMEYIEEGAFFNNQLTNITIPDSVILIEDFAFANNPINSVTSESTTPAFIFENSFGSRTNVDLIIPDGSSEAYNSSNWVGFRNSDVQIINQDGFRIGINTNTNTAIIFGLATGNQNNEIVIPSSIMIESVEYTVTSIAISAFVNNQLTSVTIPNGVTSIGSGAFANNQLTSVTIPNGVTSIGNGAFFGSELTSVVIPETVTEIGDFAFAANQLTSVTFTNGVTSIGDGAFERNELTSVVIPETVTKIGVIAFSNNQLINVVSESTAPAELSGGGDNTFGNHNDISLTIPEGTLDAYIQADWFGFSSINENATLSTEDFNFNKKNSILIKIPVESKLEVFTNVNIDAVFVYDMLGQLVLEGSSIDKLNISSLNTGLYIIHFKTQQGEFTKKMIKT